METFFLLLLWLFASLSVLRAVASTEKGGPLLLRFVEKLGLGVRLWIWNCVSGKMLTFMWRWENPRVYAYPTTRVAKLKLLSDGRIQQDGEAYKHWWLYRDPAPAGLPMWFDRHVVIVDPLFKYPDFPPQYVIVDPETMKLIRIPSLQEQIELLDHDLSDIDRSL